MSIEQAQRLLYKFDINTVNLLCLIRTIELCKFDIEQWYLLDFLILKTLINRKTLKKGNSSSYYKMKHLIPLL